MCKALSTPATISKQRSTLSKHQSTSLPKTATMSNEFIVKFRPFDKVSKQTEHVQFVLTLSNGRNFGRHCCQKNGNNVEATVDFVEATFDFVGRIVRLIAFYNGALTLLLVWTRLCEQNHN